MKYESPAPWDVRTARHLTGLTMEEAGRLVYVSRLKWLSWERNPDHKDYKKIPPAYAELFALKTGLKEIDPIVKELIENRKKQQLLKKT